MYLYYSVLLCVRVLCTRYEVPRTMYMYLYLYLYTGSSHARTHWYICVPHFIFFLLTPDCDAREKKRVSDQRHKQIMEAAFVGQQLHYYIQDQPRKNLTYPYEGADITHYSRINSIIV